MPKAADISDGCHTCTKCKVRKPLSEFDKRSSRKIGVDSSCKVCKKSENRQNYLSREEENRAYAASYRKRNAETVAIKQAEYRCANRESLRAYFRQYAKDNSDKVNSKISRRRASKLSATPAWANPSEIESFYSAARLLSKKHGTAWHVDHIVPLVHPLVCGLHCEANLDILPGADNLRKQNRYWPDMPVANSDKL